LVRAHLRSAFVKASLVLALAAVPAAAQFGQGGSIGTMMGGATSSASGQYPNHMSPEEQQREEEQAGAFYRALANPAIGNDDIRRIIAGNGWSPELPSLRFLAEARKQVLGIHPAVSPRQEEIGRAIDDRMHELSLHAEMKTAGRGSDFAFALLLSASVAGFALSELQIRRNRARPCRLGSPRPE
jgi:hypothetical protein